jgi:hypothetical protein
VHLLNVGHVPCRLMGFPRAKDLCAALSPEKARYLLESLAFYLEEDPVDPGLHHHLASVTLT